MADQLFPVFDFPEIDDTEVEKERYKPSVYFDFEQGDFVRDGANRLIRADGKEAFIQWCIKTISTERGEFIAYDDDIGTELEQLADITENSHRQSVIEETIIDALSVHPAFESASDFVFSNEGDKYYVSFTVKGYSWNEESLTVSLHNR